MLFRGVAQVIEDNSRLHASDATHRVDLKNFRHVTGKVEDDRDVAALPGERCAASSAQQRGTEPTANGDCGHNIIGVAGHDYADGNLPII
jgi:hypothetical protein